MERERDHQTDTGRQREMRQSRGERDRCRDIGGGKPGAAVGVGHRKW